MTRRVYSVDELLALPEPRWLIPGVLRLGGCAVLYGPPGHGKTFLALDWALSVATGASWCGRECRRRRVVYVSAEGGRSIAKRVRAWSVAHPDADLSRASFFLEAVQVHDSHDVVQFLEQLQGRRPGLIVLDTFARCFVGGEENSAKDVGIFIAGVEAIQRTTSATVLILHHTSKNDKAAERGSTALRAAADAMIAVALKDDLITITNTKQKDDEPFSNLAMTMKPVTMDSQQSVTSCVLQPSGAGGDPLVRRSAVPAECEPTLRALAACPNGQATTTEWMAAAGAKERTLHLHRERLCNAKLVLRVCRGQYKVTDSGHALISAREQTATATGCNSAAMAGRPIPAATATTRKGGRLHVATGTD